MKRLAVAALALCIMALAASVAPAAAETPSSQHLPIQGWIADAAGARVPAADVVVRVYSAASGGTLLYDSGTEFAGAVAEGRLDIVAGAGAPLLLDIEAEAWLELQIGADEVIGDAAAGRWRFRPGGGSHARPDLAARLATLETALGIAAGARDDAPAAADGTQSPAAGTTLRFGEVRGLLGLGRAAGTGGGVTVVANLLQQPVGPYVTATHRAYLGPHYLLPRDVAAPVPDATPARFALHPCQPNPFNPRTTVRYDLPRAAPVVLAIYDLSGRRVRTLRDGADEPAGSHEAEWDGRDDGGRVVPSGVYVCRLTAGEYRGVRRVALVK